MAGPEAMIAAGIGCRAGCSAADIIAAVREAASRSGVGVDRVLALCSGDFKASEAGLQEAAAALNKPLQLLSRAALAREATSALTASSHVASRFALPSVAETAALAGARWLGAGLPLGTELRFGAEGARSELLSARSVVGGAACALARLERPA